LDLALAGSHSMSTNQRCIKYMYKICICQGTA
jgi:hypothetical protein